MEPMELSPPTADLDLLWNMGLAGAPLVQYLKWADDLKIFQLLAAREKITLEEVVAGTTLSARGADALLGVLSSLRVVARVDGQYQLSTLAREYLLNGSPFYVGPSLYGMLENKLPPRLQKGEKVKYFAKSTGTFWHRLKYFFSSREMGRPERLAVQHSRNYPAAVVAVKSGLFDGIHHLLDVGGGSGAFAIPLVQSRTDVEVTLMELPRALPPIRSFLHSQQVFHRVNLCGFNMHKPPWPVVNCDGVLLANILHFCSDGESRELLQEAARILPPGGKLLVHEMLWNDNKDGPLATALWNFWMISVSAGRQRTLPEILQLLIAAGFAKFEVVETWGSFSMISCVRA